MNSKKQSSKPDLYVVARIIRSLNKKNNVNKTTLAVSSELSYDKFIKYLDWMLDKNFVVIDENGLVSLTEAGSEAYEELVQWIMKYVGQLKFPRLRPSV